MSHIPFFAQRWHAFGVGLLALALTACAPMIRLDNQVRSYSNWETSASMATRPTAGDRYRFERRPSQQHLAAGQQQVVEDWAAQALARVGLQADDGVSPVRWTVELGLRSTQLPYSPWQTLPRRQWNMGVGHTGPHGGVLFGTPGFPVTTPPYYVREVSIIMRDAQTAQVVYETSASHDGPWPDQAIFWAALLDAALQGFPQPPQGTRQVVIEVPR